MGSVDIADTYTPYVPSARRRPSVTIADNDHNNSLLETRDKPKWDGDGTLPNAATASTSKHHHDLEYIPDREITDDEQEDQEDETKPPRQKFWASAVAVTAVLGTLAAVTAGAFTNDDDFDDGGGGYFQQTDPNQSTVQAVSNMTSAPQPVGQPAPSPPTMSPAEMQIMQQMACQAASNAAAAGAAGAAGAATAAAAATAGAMGAAAAGASQVAVVVAVAAAAAASVSSGVAVAGNQARSASVNNTNIPPSPAPYMVNPPRDPLAEQFPSCGDKAFSKVGKTTIQFQGVDRMLDDGERTRLAQDFKTAYNDVSAGCLDIYQRFLEEANLITQSTFVDDFGSSILLTEFSGTVRCRDCPDHEPLFGHNEKRRNLQTSSGQLKDITFLDVVPKLETLARKTFAFEKIREISAINIENRRG
jgi:hypothetical protein